MTGCSMCGLPAERPETHHDNEHRGDNSPDNLRDVHRRCHMHHHGNDRATDHRSAEGFGPRSPSTGPPTLS
ncbi:HNH endonuclease signature motif containing protein [Halorarum salinum]|uniref:HNH endonuclease n=1 Tax=Halorarum salinum TaxID=2743089 RepID=A0A7D5LD18_9EURY|nr:HNH endonuclease signature motif containing protein [Halobaculum salinum]QLG63095.1 HNH endonuclease [Halobaculum salinum]